MSVPYDAVNNRFVPVISERYNSGMSISDDAHLGVLLEEFRDQNKAVLEAIGGMCEELKQDIKIIKAAVTDLSHQMNCNEHRIKRLEATT